MVRMSKWGAWAWASGARQVLRTRVAAPAAMLVEDQKTVKRAGVGKDQMLRMENEMSSLQRQYKLVEQTYGQDVLNLVLAKGYLGKLLANSAIRSYLQRNHPEILGEFKGLAEVQSLDP
jgi:hypothetical protein